MPTQVINIATGRRISTANAVASNHLGGFINAQTSSRVVSGLNAPTSVYRLANYEYDSIPTSMLSSETKQVHLVGLSVNGSFTHNPIMVLNSADLSSLNTFTMEGFTFHTFADIPAIGMPDFMYLDVVKFHWSGAQAGDLSYAQFVSQPSRTTSIGELTHSPAGRVPRYKVNSGVLIDGVVVVSVDAGRVPFGMYSYAVGDTDSANALENNRIQRGSNRGARIFPYHGSGQYRCPYDATMETGKWYFGIEAEKQDATAREYADYRQGMIDGWGAERDGSLCGSSGVEFISPILPLHDGSKVRKEFQKHKWLLDAKLDNDGRASRTACGGHMTLSKKGMDGSELMNHLHHFMPLLYSLYIGRLNTNYGGAVRKEQASYSRRAVNVKSRAVEIRIFSGVPSMEGAWWRVQLLQVMANMIDSGEVNSYKDVANAMVEDKHPLRKVLRKMYDSARLRDKFALVLTFGHLYENQNGNIDISGTSDKVVRKADRMMSTYNSFSDVRTCIRSVWGVDSISVS